MRTCQNNSALPNFPKGKFYVNELSHTHTREIVVRSKSNMHKAIDVLKTLPFLSIHGYKLAVPLTDVMIFTLCKNAGCHEPASRSVFQIQGSGSAIFRFSISLLHFSLYPLPPPCPPYTCPYHTSVVDCSKTVESDSKFKIFFFWQLDFKISF